MAVAIRSLVKPWSAEYLDETILTATNFGQNLQLDLARPPPWSSSSGACSGRATC